MLQRNKRRKEDGGAPKWMVTYSDLMTLILVFFILLFSMSAVDAQKFRVLTESFQQRQIFDFLPSAVEFDHPGGGLENGDLVGSEDLEDEEDKGNDAPLDEMDLVLQEVQRYLEQNELTDVISATRDDRGVVLVLQERMLFETAEAILLSDAIPFLDKVGTLIEKIPNMVRVEGHTDSRPISTFRYPSNWELSGARASSVIRYLIENYDISPSRFLSIGYGDTRPAVPNTSIENLQKNRRVIVVITDPESEGEHTY